MAEITVLRERIAAQISGNVARHDGRGSLPAGTAPPAKVAPPEAAVLLGAQSWDDRQSGGLGMDIIALRVVVYVSRSNLAAGEAALDRYVASTGDCSVKAALEANRKLRSDPDDPSTGVCDRLHVLGTNDPGFVTVGDVEFLVVEFNLAATCAPD